MSPPPPGNIPPSLFKNAAQIQVVEREVAAWVARQVVDGLMIECDLRYYYAGNGDERVQITEECFRGRDDENPRHPGYYLIEALSLDGEELLSRAPWIAVFRDQSFRPDTTDRSQDGAWGHITEEYRILHARARNDADHERTQHLRIRKEADGLTAAMNLLRSDKLTAENTASAALDKLARMAAELEQAQAKILELETDAASFAPQIQQAVDHLSSKVEPFLFQLLPAIQASMSGDGGSVASEPARRAPPASTAEPLSAPDTARAMYDLFWVNEFFGRCCVAEGHVPWSLIRSIVLHVTGQDLGPDPVWPSDVREDAAGSPPTVTQSPDGA